MWDKYYYCLVCTLQNTNKSRQAMREVIFYCYMGKSVSPGFQEVGWKNEAQQRFFNQLMKHHY